MAKQMVFEDEARQPLLTGVSKLARAVRSTLGPRGRNAVLDKGWGSPKITKDGVTVAEDIELGRPERKSRGPAGQGGRQQDERCGRRWHDHRHRAGRGDLSGRTERWSPPEPIRWPWLAGSTEAVEAVTEAIGKMRLADRWEEQEGNSAGRHHRRQQRSRRSAACWPTRS